MSLPMDSKVTAVDSRNLYLNYSKGKSKVIALNNLSLSIPSGCIFCLIGPSGCGKTSYLRTLIGLIKTQSGSTTIFGHPLGHRDLMIPGRDLGYMPQDIALNYDLTIGEMLNYFNRLLNTYSSSQNNKVIDHNHTNRKLNDIDLLSSLSLPSKDTLIGSLSGGQKRRVSFLCSILHSPKLIILDEPTVGCDPVVICSMWKLLHSITSTGQSTVIITTHYLEEARRTDIIGFMRKGQLLESGSPAQVLNRLSVNSIEAAFALMCQQFKKNKKNRPSIQHDELNLINVVKNTQPNLSKQMTDQSLENYQLIKQIHLISHLIGFDKVS
ncbi:ABC transporter G family member 20-like [Panonychus citri]|uniref:ABC transporter G family member 20-like n=1 Tax=Panonychus citri TaxID=50023 RepID=UPI002306FDC7|nr:ABC transporter G family member 20-like [Panonychus citri]